MKVLRLCIAFVLCCGITVFQSCCQDASSPCQMGAVTITSLEEEYNCVNTQSGMSIGLSDDYTVITNQTDFDNLVSGNCKPQIDFDTYNLIIGHKMVTSGVGGVEYELNQCEGTSFFSLSVDITATITTVITELTYHTLVPKEVTSSSLTVEVTVKF